MCYVRRMSDRRSALPPLVLLPGTLCDERLFAPLLAGLGGAFEPAPLDSAVVLTAHCISMRAAAEHVLSVAPQRFALLGFSLGGLVALEVALLAPERVLGLALLSVNAAAAPASTHATRRQAVLEAQRMGHDRYVSEELWPNYVSPGSQKDKALQSLLAGMAQDLGHNAFHHQTEAALTRRDYRPLLRTITMPALVLAGEHDAICPAAAQRETAEALPNAQFTSVPEAGHFALLEQQDATAASVAAWLRSVSDDVSSQQIPQEKM